MLSYARNDRPAIIHLADLHLSPKPEDAYRFRALEWLEGVLTSNPEIVGWVILGDLTHQKDRHEAAFVWAVHAAISRLGAIRPGFILMGNHDYIDPTHPFFRPLSSVRGVTYLWKAQELALGGARVLALPHRRKEMYSSSKTIAGVQDVDLVWAHQTFSGCIADSGRRLTGHSLIPFEGVIGPRGWILSGDIHRPQRMNRLVYVGSPHPINYGDDWGCRAVVWSGGKLRELRIPGVRKIVKLAPNVDAIASTLDGLESGDRIKVVCSMNRADLELFTEAKRALQQRAAKQGVQVVVLPRMDQTASQTTSSAGAAMADPGSVLSSYLQASALTPSLAAKRLLRSQIRSIA